MEAQTTFEQLLHLQRKLNEKNTTNDRSYIAELESEKCRLWQKLNEENVAVFNEIVFKSLQLYPLRPLSPAGEFVAETLDLWRAQPDWLLTTVETHYWEKDHHEGRFYKSRTYYAYLGIRNILIQNFPGDAKPNPRISNPYISALKKPRRWLSKLETDLKSVGKRLNEIAPALKRRTVRVLFLPSGEREFVLDDPGEDLKLLKESQERFPKATVINAADIDVLDSMRNRDNPYGSIILTRFWIPVESFNVMAVMVRAYNKDLSKWKINGSPVRRRGAPKKLDVPILAAIEICRFLQEQLGTPDYELASKIMNQRPYRSKKNTSLIRLKKPSFAAGHNSTKNSEFCPENPNSNLTAVCIAVLRSRWYGNV